MPKDLADHAGRARAMEIFYFYDQQKIYLIFFTYAKVLYQLDCA